MALNFARLRLTKFQVAAGGRCLFAMGGRCLFAAGGGFCFRLPIRFAPQLPAAGNSSSTPPREPLRFSKYQSKFSSIFSKFSKKLNECNI
ncbi:hypothetical protein [Methanimicrococcus hongohii]|uniref:hypothetical protein n=1 Tax=Methanimicrococcus hongohii TaxID=3028295 RepID=UPI00292EFCE7|nr:hypothetical protein [Methanimicrococcus sp. Hf6]